MEGPRSRGLIKRSLGLKATPRTLDSGPDKGPRLGPDKGPWQQRARGTGEKNKKCRAQGHWYPALGG